MKYVIYMTHYCDYMKNVGTQDTDYTANFNEALKFESFLEADTVLKNIYLKHGTVNDTYEEWIEELGYDIVSENEVLIKGIIE